MPIIQPKGLQGLPGLNIAIDAYNRGGWQGLLNAYQSGAFEGIMDTAAGKAAREAYLSGGVEGVSAFARRQNAIASLDSLRSFDELTDPERKSFLDTHSEAIERLGIAGNPIELGSYYKRRTLADAIGEDAYYALRDTGARFDDVYSEYRNGIIQSAFDQVFGNKDFRGVSSSHIGLGDDYDEYNQMSTASKLALLRSGFKTEEEFEQDWKDKIRKQNDPDVWAYVDAASPMRPYDESSKESARGYNERIRERIYTLDGKRKADSDEVKGFVSKAYHTPDIVGGTDEDTEKMFQQAITPGSYIDEYGRPNQGVSWYVSHYGEHGDEITSEMEDMTIDEKREFLAKKYVYDKVMSPRQAASVLNDEAQAYVSIHQSPGKKIGLLQKDILVSAMTYTLDKIDGIYETGLRIKDALSDTPTVYVSSVSGEVVDPNKHKVYKSKNGSYFYLDEDNNPVLCHPEQLSRVALHQAGKNADGSEDDSLLNPVYRTKAEQYGTFLDSSIAKYEKWGVSPNQVAWMPGKDSDLLYETFKMASFSVADGLSMLLPYGVGSMGKALSTAGGVGKVGRGIGKVMEVTGDLAANRYIQGTLGAVGIADAYERGAFRETLEQNLLNADETLLNRARDMVQEKYDSDEDYMDQVDQQIAARAASMKAEYLNRLDGSSQAMDDESLDSILYEKARQAVFSELIEGTLANLNNGKEAADLRARAYTSAARTANLIFIPEAVKYSLVNALGFRKWRYQNPNGIKTKLDASFKGLKEARNAEGKLRMVPGKKFQTWKQKALQAGKTAGKQIWGGAWTNGTDDMMVDAAERINEDSYDRYTRAYEQGRAIADVYGFSDALWSYVDGLIASLGQETTWNAAAVGGLGSVLTLTPNFANIASLATKEGRKAYKERFQERPTLGENGKFVRDENGDIVKEKVGRKDNWRERFSFFFQNGILDNYYAAKQGERELAYHADFVNTLLDDNEDFRLLTELVASDIALENATSLSEEKTQRFMKGLVMAKVLQNLGKQKDSAIMMSSVATKAMDFLDKASRMTFDGKKNPFTDEEIEDMLNEYYSSNPSVIRRESPELRAYDDQKALYQIAENAQELKEAIEAYDEAGDELGDITLEDGRKIDLGVKSYLQQLKALDKHWRKRLSKMKEEIDDPTEETPYESAGVHLLSSLGGEENASMLVRAYDIQMAELREEIDKQRKIVEEKEKTYNEKKKKASEAESANDSYTLEKEASEALNDLNSARMQLGMYQNMWETSRHKQFVVKDALEHFALDAEKSSGRQTAQEAYNAAKEKADAAQEALDEHKRELKGTKGGSSERRKLNSKIKELEKERNQARREEKELKKKAAEAESAFNQRKLPVLTADEIFSSLTPTERARMLSDDNQSMYSQEQQKEIENLKKRLLMRDPDALTKIQDIARLTQRIETSGDAYYKVRNNPEAAAREFEARLNEASAIAHNLTVQRMAETVADAVRQMMEIVDIKNPQEEKEARHVATGALKKVHHTLLDRIEKSGLLPGFDMEIANARGLSRLRNDVASVVEGMNRTDDEKKNLMSVVESVMDEYDTAKDAHAALEKVVDDTDGNQSSKDFNEILEGLEKMEYQRDAVVIEKREERRKKQAEEKRLREEQRKRDAQAALEAARLAEEERQRKLKEKSELEKALGGEEDLPIVPEEEVIGEEGIVPLAGKPVVAGEGPKTDESASETHKDGDVTSKTVVDKDGTKVTKFTQYRKAKSGEVKAVTGRTGGLKIDTSLITPETAAEVSLYDDAVLVELREKDGEFAGTVYATIENADGSVAGDHIEVKFTKNPLEGREVKEETEEEPAAGTDENKAGQAEEPVFKPLTEQEALDAIIKHYTTSGVSTRDFTKALYGTRFVREATDVSGNKGFILNAMAIEEAIGDYLTGKYPHLVVAARSGGKAFPVVKDIDGHEYGTPSSVLQQYSKGVGRYKELLDGKPKELKPKEPVEEEVETTGNGDVRGASPSLKAQLSQTGKEPAAGTAGNNGRIVTVSNDSNGSMATETSLIERSTETNPEFLSGTSMMPWQKEPLETSGILEHKKGKEENDSMNMFYRWMDSMGINLQAIIDHELANILSENPHMPVRFMTVRPEDNATHDKDVESTLFLVVDYDDKVKAHHREKDYGGVVESLGKKYLIVGTVGYGKKGNKAREQLYWNLFNRITKGGRKLGLALQGAEEFWENNKGERFRVVEGIHTEIVPGSLIPGYRVRRLEQEEGTTVQVSLENGSNHRDIRELFVDDPSVNPYGFKSLEGFYFGIQEGTAFASTVPSGTRFATPGDIERNLGNAFVFLPASNGMMFPAEIQVLKYKGMQNGRLKTRVDELLRQLTSTGSYEKRYGALLRLQKIFYFASGGRGDTFLLGKKSPTVTIVSEGIPGSSFRLDDSFDFAAFMDAFMEMDPRINITMELLSSGGVTLAKDDVLTMEDYADAGAFKVDLAKLGTSGASYSIYGIDANGKMTGYGKIVTSARSTSLEDRKVKQIPYGTKDRYYSYDPATKVYSRPGETVTSESDPGLFEELEYNRRILDNKLIPADNNGIWFTYILASGTHPEVVEVHSSTYKVRKLSEEEARKRIEEISKKKADKARGANAEGVIVSEERMSFGSQLDEGPATDGHPDNGIEDDVLSAFGLDAKEGDSVPLTQAPEGKGKIQDDGIPPEGTSIPSAPQVDLSDIPGETPSSMTFGELYGTSEYFEVLDELVGSAFPDAVDVADIEARLKEKGVDTTSIGNTKEETDAWVQQLKCRLM